MDKKLDKGINYGGIYVHIPFCKHKCLYCDFYTAGAHIVDWKIFVDRILNELKERLGEISWNPETLYLGGGTPSIIPIENFKELVTEIKNLIGKSTFREFTIEVNPEDVNYEKIQAWEEMGVNRISMGLQSLNDKELKSIGRYHDSSRARTSFKLLNQTFNNISVDVMFGLPGQTVESYNRTLEELISWGPKHISSYSLMLEEGTAMTLLERQGRITLPEESEWLKMFELTTFLLRENGYIRYEISNYALSGFESLHNSNYWLGLPYLGLGPGAHSYDGRSIRKANPNDIKGYMRIAVNQKKSLKPHVRISEFEPTIVNLTEIELREEMIMTRLRMARGLNLKDFEIQFGKNNAVSLIQTAKKYLDRGFMQLKEDYLSFTDSGFILSDSILSSLI